MRTSVRTALATLVACAMLALPGRAQTSGAGLTLGLFERYLEALRLEYGVPGLSAAVIEDDRVWERGFGLADMSANIAATPTTPYPITGLSQSVGAALVLYHCVASGRGTLNDRVLRWTPFAEPTTTIGHLLTHVSPNGTFRYDPGRYSTLTDVAAECDNEDFENLLADGILSRFGMVDSVPGPDATSSSQSRFYSDSQLDRYRSALRRLAVPYKLDSKRTASRSEYNASGVNAATGIISTVRDLAQFDTALASGALLRADLTTLSWSAPPGRPTGLGWFVQPYNGQRIVWQFGLASDAYSSLIVKIPDRRITLILLANSDSLTKAINPQAPDVTHSLFARTFLRLYIS
jgi:CubicO group peptidase (beta-lactamase class C family)